jgi:hypothetical protein
MAGGPTRHNNSLLTTYKKQWIAIGLNLPVLFKMHFSGDAICFLQMYLNFGKILIGEIFHFCAAA